MSCESSRVVRLGPLLLCNQVRLPHAKWPLPMLVVSVILRLGMYFIWTGCWLCQVTDEVYLQGPWLGGLVHSIVLASYCLPVISPSLWLRKRKSLIPCIPEGNKGEILLVKAHITFPWVPGRPRRIFNWPPPPPPDAHVWILWVYFTEVSWA